MATGNKWRTAIAYGDRHGVYLRGYDLKDLVRKLTFAQSVLLLAKGELPTEGEARVLDAIFVSALDHGIVPSSTVTRYLASAGSPLQAAVAGGVMAFGDIYGGASEALAKQLALHAGPVREGQETIEEAANSLVRHFAEKGRRIPGYGHALHPDGDPRVPVLYGLADEAGVTDVHSRIAFAVEASIERSKGRRFPLNQDGAIAAVGLDLGLDWRVIRALAFIPRSAGLTVHAVEEMTRETGWRHVPDEEVTYDGPPRRPFPGNGGA